MSNAPSLDQESEIAIARLRRSFDDGLAGHAVAAPDGRILACNPEFARITGFDSVEAAMSANLHELEPQPGAFLPLLQRLTDSPLIPLEELRFIRRDGTPAQVLARLAATRGEDGSVMEIRVYLVDITQRFLEEQKLRAGAELLRLVELATQDVLWDWNVATAQIIWSGATARRFRYTEDEVRPALDWHAERIHPEDRERVLRGVQRAMFGIDAVWSDEYRVLRGDGTYATVLDRAHIVRNVHGEPVRIVGSILDITELKATEESQRFLAGASAALEAALNVNATAAALARVGISRFAEFCVVDLLREDGSLRRVAVAHMQPGLEAALEPDLVVTPPSHDDFAPLRAVRTGEAECMAAGMMTPDAIGRQLRVSDEVEVRACMVVPISARNRVTGAVTFGYSSRRRFFDPMHVMTARDLAERAGRALDNAYLYEAAKQAVESRNEVLGVVSHDLRVPVHTIVATLSLLSDSMPERRSEVRKLFDILHRATSQIDHLIENLLTMSRIESKQFTVAPREASVASMVMEACDTLRALADAKGITISANVDSDVPPVAADAPEVVRVIGNLVGNAIKFSPPETRIGVEARAADDTVVVSVHDEGPGIRPEQIPHVFDRFWRGQPEDRRGSGLGLAIARGVVEAHGGRIWVDTNVDSGSTFSFSLPAIRVSPKAEDPRPNPKHGSDPESVRKAGVGGSRPGRSAPGEAQVHRWRDSQRHTPPGQPNRAPA